MKNNLIDAAFILTCIAVIIFTAWVLKGIISNLIKDIKQLLVCNHDYYRAGFREAEDKDIRYSERLYKCDKCGHEIWVDGRSDYINKPPKEYYYILRDGYWWQRVSKLIYDNWSEYKMIRQYPLEEHEIYLVD